GQNSQHSPFGARRDQLWRWRFGIQAAIAWAFHRTEDASLAFEAEDRAIYVGLAGENTGVIYEIACRKIVGAIGNDVEFFKQLDRIFAGKAGLEFPDSQKRIHRLQLLGGRIELRTAHVSGRVDDLTLQVRVLHYIEIHNAERANAGCAEI